MKKVTLKDKTFRISIPYEDISKAIDQVADKINTDFRGCTDVPVLLPIPHSPACRSVSASLLPS